MSIDISPKKRKITTWFYDGVKSKTDPTKKCCRMQTRVIKNMYGEEVRLMAEYILEGDELEIIKVTKYSFERFGDYWKLLGKVCTILHEELRIQADKNGLDRRFLDFDLNDLPE